MKHSKLWVPIVVLNMFLAGCVDGDENRRRAFIKQFITSIHDDTSFYREYLEPAHLDELEEGRKWLTREFVIEGRDRSGFGPYEYRLRFSNDAIAVITIARAKGDGWEVGFAVHPKPEIGVGL